MILWPCIIKFDNDDTLLLLKNEADWNGSDEIQQARFRDADRLIDACGQVFTVATDKPVLPDDLRQDERVTLEEILTLIRAHAAQQGACCLAKLYAPDIASAYNILASLDES